MEATLVGWCPDCMVYVEPYTKGEVCPGYGYDKHASLHLHKRRMFICREDGCDGEGFFLSNDFLKHQDYHAEQRA